MLESALALRRRGLSVIPIPRPDATHDGKRPSIAWKPYQTTLASEDEIREWFSTPQNIGVITGAISNVVAVDADSPEALAWIRQRLPYTPWQTRTSRGFHLWYRHPGVEVRNRAHLDTGAGRVAVDVRGDGGYVIAPGSVHASGHVYQFAGDWTVSRDRLPRFWPGWIARPERPVPPPRPRPAGDVAERARRYLAAIPPPEIGAGSDASVLYAACKLIRGFELADTDAAMLLWDWAGNRPGWTYEWILRKVKNAERYGTEPIGALR